MRVPDEFTFDLDDEKIVPVELADYARLPVSFKCRELLGEVDGSHGHAIYGATGVVASVRPSSGRFTIPATYCGGPPVSTLRRNLLSSIV